MTDIDELAYRFWSVHPKDIDEWEKTAPKMPEDYKGGMRAWFFACEMRNLVEFDVDCAAYQPGDLQDVLKSAFAAGLGLSQSQLSGDDLKRWKQYVQAPAPRSVHQRVSAALEGNVLWRFWMSKARDLAEKMSNSRNAIHDALNGEMKRVKPRIIMGDEDSIHLTERQEGYKNGLEFALTLLEGKK